MLKKKKKWGERDSPFYT